MSFDLERAAARLRSCHQDPGRLRGQLLDLLFATGAMVGESAVALGGGEALVLRAAGPAAPSLAPPLVIVAIDVEPPHHASVRHALGPASWPPELASLGGPALAIAWVTAVRALVASPSQRPWRALFFRGPAEGLGEYVASELESIEDEATVAQIVPSAAAGVVPLAAPSDLCWLDLVRPRNVWRFPACDYSYVLTGSAAWSDALSTLTRQLAAFDGNVDWTLHDVHLYFGAGVQISAVLRTSAPISVDEPGFRAQPVEPGQRVMFPVNDALAAVASLAGRIGKGWGPGLAQPLHLHARPDGLRVAFLAPVGDSPRLAERLGSLDLHWHRSPLIVAPSAAVVKLAVDSSEQLGAVAAGVDRVGHVTWQVPTLQSDADLVGLGRALEHVIADRRVEPISEAAPEPAVPLAKRAGPVPRSRRK
jgi:hypothetical protein